MSSPAHMQQLAIYNRWMNQSLYAHCATLDDATRKADRGAFFNSIHGTLNHLLLADHIWYGRFTGQPFAARSLDQQLHEDFDALRHAREEMDERLIAFVGTLTQEALLGDFRFDSMTRPGTRQCALWLALAHLFNHQTHHRGQLTTLLSQCGIDPGLTDFIAMPGVVTLLQA